MINIVHIDDSSYDINNLMDKNLSNISVLKVQADSIVAELQRLKLINIYTRVYDSIKTCRKISNELFNNDYIKKKAPISSPEFCSELASYLISSDVENSWLVSAYHWSIPIFIIDVGFANDLFGANFDAHCPLLSSETDWHLYRKVLEYNASHFLTKDGQDLSVLYEDVSLAPGFPDYTSIDSNYELPNVDNEMKYIYDSII